MARRAVAVVAAAGGPRSARPAVRPPAGVARGSPEGRGAAAASRLGLYVRRGGVGDGWRGAGWVPLDGPGKEGRVREERVEMAFWLTCAAGERAAGNGPRGPVRE